MPRAKDHHGSETGKPDSQCTSRPMPLPQRMPRSPPSDVRNAASIRNCQRISRRRARHLAHPDLARPLGHRDHHDRHDADPPDHQRDRRNHDKREVDRLRDLLECLDDRVARDQIEIVRLIELQAVPDAQDRLYLQHGVLALRVRPDDEGDHAAPEGRLVDDRAVHPDVSAADRRRTSRASCTE